MIECFLLGKGDLLFVAQSVDAEVAQSVERRSEKPCVAGSIPALGTILLMKVEALMKKLREI